MPNPFLLLVFIRPQRCLLFSAIRDDIDDKPPYIRYNPTACRYNRLVPGRHKCTTWIICSLLHLHRRFRKTVIPRRYHRHSTTSRRCMLLSHCRFRFSLVLIPRLIFYTLTFFLSAHSTIHPLPFPIDLFTVLASPPVLLCSWFLLSLPRFWISYENPNDPCQCTNSPISRVPIQGLATGQIQCKISKELAQSRIELRWADDWLAF
jgi:hypothetical protein